MDSGDPVDRRSLSTSALPQDTSIWLALVSVLNAGERKTQVFFSALLIFLF